MDPGVKGLDAVFLIYFPDVYEQQRQPSGESLRSCLAEIPDMARGCCRRIPLELPDLVTAGSLGNI